MQQMRRHILDVAGKISETSRMSKQNGPVPELPSMTQIQIHIFITKQNDASELIKCVD